MGEGRKEGESLSFPISCRRRRRRRSCRHYQLPLLMGRAARFGDKASLDLVGRPYPRQDLVYKGRSQGTWRKNILCKLRRRSTVFMTRGFWISWRFMFKDSNERFVPIHSPDRWERGNATLFSIWMERERERGASAANPLFPFNTFLLGFSSPSSMPCFLQSLLGRGGKLGRNG